MVEGSREKDESACCFGFAEWIGSDRNRDDRCGSHSDCGFPADVPLLSTLWRLRLACWRTGPLFRKELLAGTYICSTELSVCA